MTSTLLLSLDEILQHGELLLNALNNDLYTQKFPPAFDSSVGNHYRHALEHVKSVLDGVTAQEIDYDLRARNTQLETDRLFAIEVTTQFRQALRSFPPEALERSVVARCKISYTSTDGTQAPSTIAREIMFAVSHAIHHYALIKLICHQQKISLPPGFGVAPSTLKYQASSRGA